MKTWASLVVGMLGFGLQGSANVLAQSSASVGDFSTSIGDVKVTYTNVGHRGYPAVYASRNGKRL